SSTWMTPSLPDANPNLPPSTNAVARSRSLPTSGRLYQSPSTSPEPPSVSRPTAWQRLVPLHPPWPAVETPATKKTDPLPSVLRPIPDCQMPPEFPVEYEPLSASVAASYATTHPLYGARSQWLAKAAKTCPCVRRSPTRLKWFVALHPPPVGVTSTGLPERS